MTERAGPAGSGIGCFIAAGVLLAILCYGVYGARHDARIAADFGRVTAGQPGESAIGLLGRPSWRSPCQSRFPYGALEDCAEEIVYASSFAPLKPIYWTIELGSDGRVLRAHQVSSP